MFGVAFVVASFVTADSLRSTFGDLAEDIHTGTDFTIRSELPFGELTEAEPPAVSEELLVDILATPGVAEADGTFFVNGVIPVDGSGVAVTTFGPPLAGTNWTLDEEISQIFLVEGERPTGSEEFALDVRTYTEYDFELGEQYEVNTPTGPRTFTLTGIMQFGFPENAGIGVVFTIFDTATAQQVLGYPGQFSEIGVRVSAGADLTHVERQLAAALPKGVEIISAESAAEEFSDAFELFIGPLQTILLVLAFVVMFVSAFIISNSFNIVLAQRIRELSLLRAVGASPDQVLWSVMTESFAIGIVASAAGLGLGIPGALAIREILSALGAELPTHTLPLGLRTVLWAFGVGIGFTVVSSLAPAIKASRVPPMAGLAESYGHAARHGRFIRSIVGGLLLVLGIVLTAEALLGEFETATSRLSLLGAGGALVFVAVAVLSPLVAGPVVGAVTAVLPVALGVPGKLARNHAIRNPRRTAATSIALTIGLSLVAMVSIMAESMRVTLTERFSAAVTADFIITSNTSAGLPKPAADLLRASDLGTVVGIDFDRAQFNNVDREGPLASEYIGSISAVSIASLAEVTDFKILDGSLSGFEPVASLLVHSDVATEGGLRVGDGVITSFVSGEERLLTVQAIFDDSALVSDWIVDESLYAQVATASLDDILLVSTTIPDSQAARDAVDRLLAQYPQAQIQDLSEYRDEIESGLNAVLAFSTVFLGFSLVIALIGIVNTLTLSVIERTREIGMLRAVGMTSRQLRRMIRWESVTVALYGALVGLALGLVFGVVTITAVPDDIAGSVALPVTWLVIFVVVSLVFGLIAALFPTVRASRMTVIDAMAEE